jgi:hypothetical protein
LTSSLALSSPVATNFMFQVYKARTMRLRRTSAMQTRQHRVRAPIPARAAEHRHQQLQPRPPQQLQQQLLLRPLLPPQLRQALRRQLLWHLRVKLRPRARGQHRTRERSEFRNSFVGEADSFPYSWFLMSGRTIRPRRYTAINKSFSADTLVR